MIARGGRILVASGLLASGCGRIDFDPPSLFGTRGSAGSQLGEAIAVGPDGSVAVVGRFASELDLGDRLSSRGASDAFVAHLTADGGPQWARGFGDVGFDEATAVAFDPGGNVYVVGTFTGTVDFGGGPLVALGEEDAFIASFTPGGAHRWSKRFGDRTTASMYGSDEGYAVAVGDGIVYVGGQFDGTVDFGTGPVTSASVGFDAFVVALDLDGTSRWVRTFGGNNYNRVSALTAVPDGVYATGYLEGTATLAGTQVTSAGAQDIYVLGLTSAGADTWAVRLGGSGIDWGRSIAADRDGNVYVAGSFQTTVDFGNGAVTAATPAAAFVTSYGPGGAARWQRTYTQQCAKAMGIAVDAAGQLYVAGYFDGAIDAGGAVSSMGPGDGFVLVGDRDGGARRSVRIGGNGYDQVRGIAASPSNRIYVVGAIGTNDACPSYAIVTGDEDMYLDTLH